MEESPLSLARLLERDLDRIGMTQKELAAKLTDEGEPALTEQALSNWKRSNVVPRRRLDKLLEILGPNSEIARAQANGQFSRHLDKTVRFMQQVPDPQKRRHYTPEDIGLMVRSAEDLLRPQFTGAHTHAPENERLVRLRDALPQEMHANFARSVKLGALHFRFDYMSENAVIEIKAAAPSALSVAPYIYRSLYRLALIDRLYGVGYKKRVYAMLLMGTDDDAPGVERAKLEASLMGTQFRAVIDYEQAVKVIMNWEKGPQEELF